MGINLKYLEPPTGLKGRSSSYRLSSDLPSPLPPPTTNEQMFKLNDAKLAICPGKFKTLPLTPYNKILASMALCSRWETAVGAGETVTAQKVKWGLGRTTTPHSISATAHSGHRAGRYPPRVLMETGLCAKVLPVSRGVSAVSAVDHLRKRLEKTSKGSRDRVAKQRPSKRNGKREEPKAAHESGGGS